MKNIRNAVGVLLVGISLGIVISDLYRNQKNIEIESRANALVDYVISAWTFTDERTELIDTTYVAQFSAQKELPQSRLGYFPDTVRMLASIIEKKYSVPAAVTLAQWALESRWGKNNLGVSNYFGHSYPATRRFVDNPQYVLRRDVVSVNGNLVPGPVRKFTSYKNIAECFDVHGKYLSQSNLYRAAFYTSNPENFVRVIALRYAQDPDYAVKLITIIRRYKL